MKKRYYVGEGITSSIWVHETTDTRKSLYARGFNTVYLDPTRAICDAIADCKAKIRSAEANITALTKLKKIYEREK